MSTNADMIRGMRNYDPNSAVIASMKAEIAELHRENNELREQMALMSLAMYVKDSA